MAAHERLQPEGTGGTDWTAMGSYDDGLVPEGSAVDMGGAHKVNYLGVDEPGALRLLQRHHGRPRRGRRVPGRARPVVLGGSAPRTPCAGPTSGSCTEAGSASRSAGPARGGASDPGRPRRGRRRPRGTRAARVGTASGSTSAAVRQFLWVEPDRSHRPSRSRMREALRPGRSSRGARPPRSHAGGPPAPAPT